MSIIAIVSTLYALAVCLCLVAFFYGRSPHEKPPGWTAIPIALVLPAGIVVALVVCSVFLVVLWPFIWWEDRKHGRA